MGVCCSNPNPGRFDQGGNLDESNLVSETGPSLELSGIMTKSLKITDFKLILLDS
jgi:hypothetical protein